MASKPTKILVPVDFSESSQHALEYAASMAGFFGAPLHVLHCIPIGDFVRAASAAPRSEKLVETVERTEEEKLRSMLEKLASATGMAAQALVRDGPPPATILDVAAELGTDLIVMASHGSSGFRHAVLGSVTEEIVRRSPVPVLTVRT